MCALYFYIPYELVFKTYFCFCCPDIEAEKAHQSLCDSIASFDMSAMRQVSTEERVVLPTQAGDDELT